MRKISELSCYSYENTFYIRIGSSWKINLIRIFMWVMHSGFRFSFKIYTSLMLTNRVGFQFQKWLSCGWELLNSNYMLLITTNVCVLLLEPSGYQAVQTIVMVHNFHIWEVLLTLKFYRLPYDTKKGSYDWGGFKFLSTSRLLALTEAHVFFCIGLTCYILEAKGTVTVDFTVFEISRTSVTNNIKAKCCGFFVRMSMALEKSIMS